MEGGDRGEEGMALLRDLDPPDGQRPAFPYPGNRQLDWPPYGAGTGEVGVERVRFLIRDRRACGHQRLGQELTAEDAVETAALAPSPKTVVPRRFQPEGLEQSVVGGPDGGSVH